MNPWRRLRPIENCNTNKDVEAEKGNKRLLQEMNQEWLHTAVPLSKDCNKEEMDEVGEACRKRQRNKNNVHKFLVEEHEGTSRKT
jgi:hypothetical protein